jgi:polyferredoxin
VCSLLISKRPKENRAYAIKYFCLVLLLSAVILMAYKAGGFHSIDPFFGMNRESTTQDILLLFGVVVVIVPTALILGKQAHCHYFCWQAPILVAGTKVGELFRWPSLHLRIDSAGCSNCGLCDRNCPMSLEVTKMVKVGAIQTTECILCGNCMDSCPKGVIQFSFGRPEKFKGNGGLLQSN